MYKRKVEDRDRLRQELSNTTRNRDELKAIIESYPSRELTEAERELDIHVQKNKEVNRWLEEHELLGTGIIYALNQLYGRMKDASEALQIAESNLDGWRTRYHAALRYVPDNVRKRFEDGELIENDLTVDMC